MVPGVALRLSWVTYCHIRIKLTAGMDDLGPTPLGELRRRGLAVERREAIWRATL
jgi:hypothetical protein